MKSTRKTKNQLLAELGSLREHIARLESACAEGDKALRPIAQEAGCFRELAESLRDGVHVREYDPKTGETTLVFCNDRFIEMSGYSLQDLQAVEDIADLSASPPSSEEKSRRRRLLTSGVPATHVGSWKRPDGRENFYERTVVGRKTGDKYRLFGTDHDLTERRQAERILQRREELLRCLTDVSGRLLATMDIDAALPEVLRHLREVCGADRAGLFVASFDPSGEVMMVRRCKDYAPQIRHDVDSRVFERVPRVELGGLAWVETLSTGKIVSASADEFPEGARALLASNDIRSLLLVPVHVAGRWYGVVAFASSEDAFTWRDVEMPLLELAAKDVSAAVERVESERSLRAASRMEMAGTLAAGVAHDFNNLMVGVLGNADLLASYESTDPQARAILADLATSAQKASELAEQLLAFARGGKYQANLVNLNEVIEETLRRENRSLAPSIRVERRLEPGLWRIEADAVQMAQLVANVYRNAVESIEGMGYITITTQNFHVDTDFARAHAGLTPGRYVLVSVVDTGCGMTEQVRARAFEPFFTTGEFGRGLGLAAAYGIVKNHGGHIALTSELGSGTSAIIYLPGVTDGEPPKALPSGEATILVIDDEEMVLDVTGRILKEWGYRVIAANSGAEAIEIAESFDGDIHLALLDMRMPSMNGVQTFHRLVKARPETKVLICSGHTLDEDAQGLLDAGAKAFVSKPFRASELIEEVRRTLES